MKRSLYKIAPLVLLLAVSVLAAVRFLYPSGIRTCTLPCMQSALNLYAAEHNGFFPAGAESYFDDLAKLYPKYAEARILAGVSGDIRLAEGALRSGRPLDTNSTSWVYFPGLRDRDPADTMIIYERAGGVLQNGQRGPKGTHVVGFVNGTWRPVSQAEWDRFLAVQSERRAAIIRGRNR